MQFYARFTSRGVVDHFTPTLLWRSVSHRRCFWRTDAWRVAARGQASGPKVSR